MRRERIQYCIATRIRSGSIHDSRHTRSGGFSHKKTQDRRIMIRRTTNISLSIVVLATALSAVTAAEQSQACLDAISTLQTDENLQTAFAALNTEYAAFEATDFCLISETKASCLLNYQDLDSYEPFVAACGDAGGLFFTTDYDVICSDATRDDITIQFYNAPGCAGAECNLEGQDDVNLDNFLSQLLGGREGLTCSARGDSDDNGGSAAARVSILSLLGALITMEWIFLLS